MAASLAEVASVETTEAGQTAGRPAAAATLLEVAFPAGIPVMEVAVAIPMDQAVAGHQMMETGTAEDPIHAVVAAPEAEGARVAPETQGDLTVREMSRMKVMMADVGEVVAVTALWRS